MIKQKLNVYFRGRRLLHIHSINKEATLGMEGNTHSIVQFILEEI